MNEQDRKLTLWASITYKRGDTKWAVAPVYEDGKPTHLRWLAITFDEADYEPCWFRNPDGQPTTFTEDEIDEYVERWLAARRGMDEQHD